MSLSRPRVVIVGGNFAGLMAASRLSTGYDVTVVDARDEFEWTPNIHEILSGVKTRQSVVLPRSGCIGRYGHVFVQAEVTSIDLDKDCVVTADGQVLPYDACLIATGGQGTTYGIPGAQQHSIGFRLVDDAVRIGQRLDALARRKRRASVVIVGGGVSGIEALGEVLRRRTCGDEFDVHLVEIDSRILPQLPEALAEDAIRRCSSFEVHVHTDAVVTEVGARQVTLENGETLRADLSIWSAGMALPEFLRDSGLCDADDDWLPVDDTLRSLYADNVFVAGDSAGLPQPIRKQAFYAMDTGEVAGDNIARNLEDRSLRPFHPANTPMIVAFGDITTWLVAGQLVIASPLLAAGKEGVYQATMARFTSPLQPFEFAGGIASRAGMAAQRLLLPQLRPLNILSGLLGGRIVA